MNHLDACIYCKGQRPKNKRQARRLRDTRANLARELALYRALGRSNEPTIGTNVPLTPDKA